MVAALVLPGLLLGGWAAAVLGGQADVMAIAERREAQRWLGSVAAAWRQCLLDAARALGASGATVALLANGSPRGPFVQVADAPAPEVPTTGAGDLTPALWALARRHWSAGDAPAARAALAGVPGAAAIRPGGLPADLVGALLAARFAALEGDPLPARALWARLLAHDFALTAGQAYAVVEQLDRIAPAPAPDRRADYLACADLFRDVEQRRAPPTDAPLVARPGGAVVIRVAPDAVTMVSAATVTAHRAALLRTEADARPEWTLQLAAAAEDPVALRALEPGGGAVAVTAVGASPSQRLATLARRSLWSGLALVVLGGLAAVVVVRRELRWARARAEFVDLVSHELRTPLAALSLKAELLASGDVPAAKQPAYTQALHHEVRRLGSLTERILDFQRLGRRRALEPALVPGRDLLAAGLREGRVALRLAGQRLALAVPRSLPKVCADRELIARALRNLLENAAKHAPASPRIDVSAEVRDGRLVIAVADRGPGVPRAERGSIFEAFRRGSSGHGRGSGLGLALVQRTVLAHGGSIDVADRDGGGAVFTMQLPLQGAPT